MKTQTSHKTMPNQTHTTTKPQPIVLTPVGATPRGCPLLYELEGVR